MYCIEYPVQGYRGHMLFENKAPWPIPSDNSNQIIALENEIHMLRTRMEELFMEKQSFVAEDVLEISMQLDIKINEYMRERNSKQ